MIVGWVFVWSNHFDSGFHFDEAPVIERVWQKYRPAGESEEWLKRDPIVLYRGRLSQLGTAEGALEDLELAVQRAVDEATEAARASPPSPIDVIGKDVWADGGASWRN